MTCHEARELYSALLDDALAPDERTRLEAHLAECADCGLELARFQAAVSLLRSVEPAHAPAGFVAGVLAASRSVPWYRRLLGGLFLPLPLEAAALVTLAILGVYLYRQHPGLERSPRVRHDAPTAPSVAPAPPPAPYGLPEKEAEPTAAKSAPAAGPEARATEGAKVGAAQGRRAAAESPAALAPPKPEPAPGAEEAPGAPAREEKSAAATGARDARLKRSAVDQRLAELLAKVGGRELERRVADGGAVVDVTISESARDEFRRELARLGGLEIEQETATEPSGIRLTIRISR